MCMCLNAIVQVEVSFYVYVFIFEADQRLLVVDGGSKPVSRVMVVETDLVSKTAK